MDVPQDFCVWQQHLGIVVGTPARPTTALAQDMRVDVDHGGGDVKTNVEHPTLNSEPRKPLLRLRLVDPLVKDTDELIPPPTLDSS